VVVFRAHGPGGIRYYHRQLLQARVRQALALAGRPSAAGG